MTLGVPQYYYSVFIALTGTVIAFIYNYSCIPSVKKSQELSEDRFVHVKNKKTTYEDFLTFQFKMKVYH